MTAEASPHGIWDHFDSDSYIGINYQDRILPEDCKVIAALTGSIDALAEPYSVDSAADVCNGGVFAYSGVLQRLIAPSGALYCMDYSPNGVATARRTIADYRRSGDAGIWQKFDAPILAANSEYQYGPAGEQMSPVCRALSLGIAAQGSIYELPSDTFGAVATFYGPESITSHRQEWSQAMKRLVESARMGGIVAVAAMKHSEGYTTPDPEGKRVFPAYGIDTPEVVECLYDLGVRDIQTADAYDPDHSIRPPDGPQYEGICLAVGIRAAGPLLATTIV